MNDEIYFELGQLVKTREVHDKIDTRSLGLAIMRHSVGDWGDVSDEDRKANDAALQHDFRLVSQYRAINGRSFIVITEADRSMTTMLMVEEY